MAFFLRLSVGEEVDRSSDGVLSGPMEPMAITDFPPVRYHIRIIDSFLCKVAELRRPGGGAF